MTEDGRLREAARNMLRFANTDRRLYRFWRAVFRTLCMRGAGEAAERREDRA